DGTGCGERRGPVRPACGNRGRDTRGADTPRLLRPRRGIARRAGDRPGRAAGRAVERGAADRRGVRLDLRRPAGLPGDARRARRHRHRGRGGAPMTAVAIDPVTLEVVKNGLASVADEMALVVMRSAYSPVVRDTMDYSTALCDRDGELLAQGLTLAVQLGTFPTIMRHVREHFGEGIQPGDVFLANDPYGFGGQHLPDMYVIQPIFHEGELEGYAATMAHHVDVGGLTPGSIAVHATEIYQEGLRLPLLKLYEAGQENGTVIRIIEKNTRQPVDVIGDLRAQIAACRAGERGLIEILERYGTLESRRYLEELQ